MRDESATPEKPVVTQDDLLEMLEKARPKFSDALNAALEKHKTMPPREMRERKWDMSLFEHEIEPGAKRPIQYQTRCIFRGESMLYYGDKGALIVRNFYINQKPMFEDLWGLPAAEFCEKVSQRNKEMPTIGVARFLNMEVENTDSVKLTFAASLFGTIWI